MNGSGKAGGGRGYNRKHHYRRRDADALQEDNLNGRSPSQGHNSFQNNSFQKKDRFRGNNNPASNSASDKKNYPRGQPQDNRRGSPAKGGDNFRREKLPFFERPKWIPPKMAAEPLPVPLCPWCGKPIKDISSAISDKDSGEPVHFDCVTVKIAGTERLEQGDSIAYIGAGRFGIVKHAAAGNDLKIKKIIEWENKDKRAEWRFEICEYYSMT